MWCKKPMNEDFSNVKIDSLEHNTLVSVRNVNYVIEEEDLILLLSLEDSIVLDCLVVHVLIWKCSEWFSNTHEIKIRHDAK